MVNLYFFFGFTDFKVPTLCPSADEWRSCWEAPLCDYPTLLFSPSLFSASFTSSSAGRSGAGQFIKLNDFKNFFFLLFLLSLFIILFMLFSKSRKFLVEAVGVNSNHRCSFYSKMSSN